jgi:formylglycine-generating enzyme required for sulfatase activity
MNLWTETDNGYDTNNQYRNSLAKYFLPSEDEFYKAAYGKSDGSGYYFYSTASDTAPTPVASGTTAGTAVYNGVGWQPASVYSAGGLSAYGTMGQGGNIFQWEESANDGVNNSATKSRGVRGGLWNNSADFLLSSYRYYGNNPDNETTIIGFRVASVAMQLSTVPEPSTYALCGLGALALVIAHRRKKVA